MAESKDPPFVPGDQVCKKGRRSTGVVECVMATGKINVGVQYPSPPGKPRRPLAFYAPAELELANG